MNNISICLIGGMWKYNQTSKNELFDVIIEKILDYCQNKNIFNVSFHNSGILWKLEQILTLNSYDIVIFIPSELEQCIALEEAISNFIKKHKYGHTTILTNNLSFQQLNKYKSDNIKVCHIENEIDISNIMEEILMDIQTIVKEFEYA